MVGRQAEPISETNLTSLLRWQLLTNTSLKELAHYERALLWLGDKTYAYLYKVLRRWVELSCQGSSRKAVLYHHVGGGNSPATPAEMKGGGGTKPTKGGNGAQTRGRTARRQERRPGEG